MLHCIWIATILCWTPINFEQATAIVPLTKSLNKSDNQFVCQRSPLEQHVPKTWLVHLTGRAGQVMQLHAANLVLHLHLGWQATGTVHATMLSAKHHAMLTSLLIHPLVFFLPSFLKLYLFLT